ncbi:unnamed protein product [Rotaria socialis]|uniref:Uncharacterized protein n=2 Tax=Rotaria socialis TaxID=392032 RepID=A0A820PWC1_9BILA|nr:unnamed protein product [Rotaria socialis]
MFIIFLLCFVILLTEIKSLTIIANQSGDFNCLNTWSNNIQTGNDSTVIIPSDISVYISNESHLNMSIQSLKIYGNLQIGSPYSSNSIKSFKFSYPINIMVFNGGLLEELTSNLTWFLLSNSIITIYPNTSFYSSQLTKIVSNSNDSNQILSNNIQSPFTVTVDRQGTIENYSCKLTITFVPYQSGNFGLNSTWLGELASTLDRCSPIYSGCVLFIPAHGNVTRHNQSTINAVYVHIYGFFEISPWETYLFRYPMKFLIYDGEKNSTISSYKFNKADIVGPYTISIDMNGNIDDGSLFTSTMTTTTVTTALIASTISCYLCTDCEDSFSPKNVATVTVPANQGYFSRMSESINLNIKCTDFTYENRNHRY